MPTQDIFTASIGTRFTLIPTGEILMGSPASEAGDFDSQHTVRITKPFYMGVTPVTQQQYEQVTGRSSSGFKGDDHPVQCASW